MEESSTYRPGNLLYTQEKISRYRRGGYHPVNLGDTFKDGRYKVYHKLGWGGYSTVWLARDRKRDEWVSIKIMTADSSERSKELAHLQSLTEHGEGSLSSRYIVQLLDRFTHQGPNGVHLCLVFELLGPSVDAVIQVYNDGGDRLDAETILKMSEQLLEAIAFMHDFGFAHGGIVSDIYTLICLPISFDFADVREDLSGRNVAFSCNSLSHLSEESLFEILEVPELEELVRIDGKPLDDGLPSHVVKATGWDYWIDEDDEDLRILDFGETFRQGAEPERLAQPGHLQAPETIFTDKLDYRVDLWRAGLMIYSFIFGAMPFQCLGEVDVLVMQMIGFVEELPSEWQQKWVQLVSKCTLENSAIVENQRPKSKLEERFNERVQDQSLKPLLSVIRGLVRFRPSDRISASQAFDLCRRGGGEIQKAEDASNIGL